MTGSYILNSYIVIDGEHRMLRGGTKLFSHFAFSDFERTPSPHFTLKTPPNDLKMMEKLFSTKIIFQNLTPIFHFWGIPDGPKLFFSENVLA